MLGFHIFGGCVTSIRTTAPRRTGKGVRERRSMRSSGGFAYSQHELEALRGTRTDFETFFADASAQTRPRRDQRRNLRVRIGDIAEPAMREIRYLDKLTDELAKVKMMEKILRGEAER